MVDELISDCLRITAPTQSEDANDLWRDVIHFVLQRLDAIFVQILFVLVGKEVEAAALHQEIFSLLLADLGRFVESLFLTLLELDPAS